MTRSTRVRCPTTVAAAVLVLVAVAACSSGPGGDGDEGDGREPKTVAVEELPPAGGRAAFAISDESAIVGGGDAPEDDTHLDLPYPVHSVSDLRYSPVHDLWLLGEDGRATELPSLPADGSVAHLSGSQVGDAMVLAGYDCRDTHYVNCRLVLWARGPDERDWTTHELSDGALSEAPFRGSISGTEGSLTVLGSFDWEEAVDAATGETDNTDGTEGGSGVPERAILAVPRGDPRHTTRYLAFDPADASLDVVGDGERTVGTQHCLHREDIFELRHAEGYDPLAGDDLTELSVARMNLVTTGLDDELPIELDRRDGRRITAASIACPADGDPLISLTTETAEGLTANTLLVVRSEPPDPSDWSAPMLSTTVIEGFAEGLDALFEDGHSGVRSRIVGTTPSGDVLVMVSRGDDSALYTFNETDGFIQVEGFDEVDYGDQIFAYGAHVGAVISRDWGDIRLHRQG